MSALQNTIGPYSYGDGWLVKKTFNEHQGIPRSFTILIASAFTAGITGPELNGIVVLDDDNRQVILDQHLRQSSGYFGPSSRQIEEFERLKAMDWREFAKFCRTNPRYRGCLPDADAQIPDDGRLPQPETVIFQAEDKPPSDSPYSFPLSTRREIVEFLSGHSGHSADRHDFALSWDIKVRCPDTTCEKFRDEMGLDPRFDSKWKKFVENDNAIFWDACRDGISQWTDDEYTIYPGVNDGKYAFSTAGRSSGHLVLTKVFDQRMVFPGRFEFVQWLENEATDETLVEIYKVVASCDQDLGGTKPRDEVEYQMAFIRQNKEEDWKAELDDQPTAGGM